MSLTDKFAKLVAEAKKLGIKSFLLGLKNGPVVSIHFDNMKLSEAMEVLIAGFHQVISIDLEKNPHYSAGKKQIYKDLAKEFDALIRSTNERFAAEELANAGKK